jgi:predicted nucleic acid-binding protein
MLVIDSSAMVEALIGGVGAEALRERLDQPVLHAPVLIDFEVLNVLRRSAIRGHLSEDRAYEARVDYWLAPLERYPARSLEPRMWDLRETLSIYDAAFVALAEALELPLVTCDARLAGAPGHRASVELFAPGY